MNLKIHLYAIKIFNEHEKTKILVHINDNYRKAVIS
jgi:hypothetical protein